MSNAMMKSEQKIFTDILILFEIMVADHGIHNHDFKTIA